MNIVITMAGLGTRFSKVGYQVPKHKIEVCGKTLFEWSMLSLTELNGYEDARYIFIVRKETDSKDFILEKMKSLGVEQVDIIEIEEVTDGQASTAMLAKEFWHEDEELIIYNIDTYIEPGEIRRTDFSGDGFIPCFDGAGDHWSFVRLDDEDKAVEIAEKKRISNHCSIGLYYFKNCHLYVEAYQKYYASDTDAVLGEKYIAPIYNFLIKNGLVVEINDIPKEKVHCLGTPEELEEFKHLF